MKLMNMRLSVVLLVCHAAAAQIITTVAGTSYTFPSGSIPAVNAPLGVVAGAVVDTAGNVFVSDGLNDLVLRISPDGTLNVVAGNGILGASGDGGPATSASLRSPQGVAVDSDGNLYIANTGNGRIQKVSGGTITTVAGGGNGNGVFSGDGGPATGALLNTPSGVAVDSAGNLYIADSNNNRIRKVSNGTITTIAGNGNPGFSGDGGPAASASLNDPVGVAVDSAGNLYIAERLNSRIRKVSNGTITTIAGNGNQEFSGDGGSATSASLSYPSGVAVDSAGNLYIADLGNNRIRKVSYGTNTTGTITTVAGNGNGELSGDGGPATNASLSQPEGVAVDSTGNLYIADTQNFRVRKVSYGVTTTGTITTLAGNGNYRFSGDGGPATSATLNGPVGVAVDAAGNLSIADFYASRIRRVSKGTISTVAGNGVAGFSGDGGPAASASINSPIGVAFDSGGNLYLSDTYNNRIREVSGGTITTVAGNGTPGFSGDGGPATSASLNQPRGVAIDSAGKLYFADYDNNRVRKLSGGTITTVAGNGSAGFSGDGGPATAASLNGPYGVAVDSVGNLYISDFNNNRIRRVSGGTITTVAGNGTAGFSGDGGPATSASLKQPFGVAVDAAGNLYIADAGNFRIRKVSAGTISTFAGSGTFGFSGDGGPATSASLSQTFGVAVDAAGNVYFSDSVNSRIREVLVSTPSFQATPASLSFSATAGGAAPGTQNINLSSTVAGLSFTASTSASWLSVNPSSGSAPSILTVSADPTGLASNNYQGTITIGAPNAVPSTQVVTVSFSIGVGTTPSSLAVSSQSFSFSLAQGASPATAQLTISNQGITSTRYTAAASTSTGGNWLQISSSSGSVSAAAPASLTVTANPGTLAPGTYNGAVTVTGPDTGQTLTVGVVLAVTAAPPNILLSQVGFTFSAVAQGGTVLPQSLGILNSGAGILNYSVQATTQSGASGWLSVSDNSGTVIRPLLDVSFINVIVNASSLAAGTYYGQITVSASTASNSPQTALVVLTVLPAGSNPGPDVRPTGLIFTGAFGAENPGSQNVTVANVTGTPTTFATSLAILPGAGAIVSQPTNFTVPPDAPEPIVVQPDFSMLTAPGVGRAALTVAFDDGSIRNVAILTVVAPAGTPIDDARANNRAMASSACIATKLLPQFTAAGFSSNLILGYPAFISVTVVDDCGVPLTSGSVVVSFDNGDAPLALIDTQEGTWTASWEPSHTANSVTLTLTASQPSLNLIGTAQETVGGVQKGSQSPPLLTGAPLGAGTQSAGSFAPGDLILLKGTGLADEQATSTSPLKNLLGGASVILGGAPIPLLYADTGQVVGLVPPDASPNASPQLIVSRDAALGFPVSVIISTTHPAVLTADGSGQGQALIYKANGTTTTLANTANPVNPGDSIVVYCTGLGVTNANGSASNTPVLNIGGLQAQISYAGVGLPANYPAGGAPTLLGVVSAGLGGLYQINATVPAGIGGAVPVTISSAGAVSQAGVTMMLAALSSGGAPVISSIDTDGGFPTIAQNGWIEIKGSNLAPSSVGAGMVWNNAPDFAFGEMPTQLGGVGVTVDGKPAFVYFVSPTQINVLTPLDSTTGPVQVVVNNNGVSSAAFTASENAVAPSFPLFSGAHYMVATHANGSLAGSASLSVPGYPVTPVAPGETVVLYAFGFGLPSTPLVNGSSSQSGSLPVLPVIQIGGTQANVTFAGVILPGLYQINVTIPPTAANGDNTVICTYGGFSSPAGDLITIQQ
jgi:trimeric autotransporter adhesin